MFDSLNTKSLRSMLIDIESNINQIDSIIFNDNNLSSLDKLMETINVLKENDIDSSSIVFQCVQYTTSTLWKKLLEREISLRELEGIDNG